MPININKLINEDSNKSLYSPANGFYFGRETIRGAKVLYYPAEKLMYLFKPRG